MTEPRLKILPPWSTYIHKLEALFDGDAQIAFNVVWTGEHPSVVLSTNNPEKAAAIRKLLPEEKRFGNVFLYIDIQCQKTSNIAFKSTRELFETAFNGNPAFAYAVTPPEETWTMSFTYIVFKNCVVQFYNDNLNDPHGVISTLYQEIASEVFEECDFPAGVAYCTDVERKLGKSVEEWLR